MRGSLYTLKWTHNEDKYIKKTYIYINIYLLCNVPPMFCSVLSNTQSMVIGWTQHLNLALRMLFITSASARSSIITISVNGGRTSGFASQQRVNMLLSTGRQSVGIAGLTPLFTTANAACTAVMFWNGTFPVNSSHSTIPKLYTSTFCV